jgi:putative endonuclease
MHPTPGDPDPARAQGRPPLPGPPPTSKAQTPPVGDALIEQAAADYVQLAGLRILNRNWRCPEGKIDIVAAEQRVLVVCQIQDGSAPASGTQVLPVSRAEQRRLRRVAVRWLVVNGVLFDEIRIDVVRLTRARTGDFTIEHLRGVG